jgi:hypothetical protein
MKLRRNPLGDYVGKIGNTVGGKWKGIYWVRTLVFPTQRGTIEMWRLLHQGLILPDRFSYKQMNLRRLSLQTLGYLGSQNMSSFITPIWEKIAKGKKLKMHGIDLFVKKNAERLYNSMPHPDKEFEETTNSPDLTTIQVTEGTLESTPILTATYNEVTGILTVAWDKTCYTNGKDTDYAYAMVLKKPILESYEYPDGNWEPALFMFPPTVLANAFPVPPGLPRQRVNQSGLFQLPAGLDPADLTVFLFFRTTALITTEPAVMSDSVGHSVVLAP